MKKSLIALAVVSTFIGSAYAETGSTPLSTGNAMSISSESSGSVPSEPAGQNGVAVVSELAPLLAEAACGCYSPPGACGL
jgi:hypothetical protein